MRKTTAWMFWWNTCPMRKAMPREYLKDGSRFFEIFEKFFNHWVMINVVQIL